ncbi:hypothetical protein [Streptomyces flaveolus]|uniref:hypothetical protein n=1 Tax=Streptomyces flaveolus TaxID=67297 RepID=UPI0036F89EE1
MFPPADRTALDLLDAHLEALWGTWEASGTVLPAEPSGLAVEGAGELVHWALGRLRSIPREPKDAFAREIGGLLMKFRSRRSPWNAAALRLLYDPYTFVATGPRRHEDWTHDVHAVLHRTVTDPRGRLRLDADRTNPARQQHREFNLSDFWRRAPLPSGRDDNPRHQPRLVSPHSASRLVSAMPRCWIQ